MENTVVLFLLNFLFAGQDLIMVIYLFIFSWGGGGGGGGGVDVGSLVKGSLISELRISFFMLWISLICIVDLNFFAS
jgi:hypothetical protein